MLVYFGRDGTLKEMVSSFTLSNGDTAYKNIQGSSVNYIYCYYEGRDPETINENSTHITFQKDGEVIVPSDIAPVAVGDWSIDFDRKQDLRYFEYEKPYRFVKFAVPNSVLATDGLASATSRLVIEGNIYSYGLITFNVSKSVVLQDSYITQSQYDYLVSIVAKGTANAGDGLLLLISPRMLKRLQNSLPIWRMPRMLFLPILRIATDLHLCTTPRKSRNKGTKSVSALACLTIPLIIQLRLHKTCVMM